MSVADDQDEDRDCVVLIWHNIITAYFLFVILSVFVFVYVFVFGGIVPGVDPA